MKSPKDSLTINFGKRLVEIRIQKGMTQERLAEAANISADFISLMERGIRAPSFITLERLSKALGVPVNDFFVFNSKPDVE
jgi:transcriptional regulator with XRE-family HTH domain